MTIKVLFFAQLKDEFGAAGRTVEVREGMTVGEFARFLFETKNSGAGRSKAAPLLYAVNEEFAGAGRILKGGDVLALLPPVAGG